MGSKSCLNLAVRPCLSTHLQILFSRIKDAEEGAEQTQRKDEALPSERKGTPTLPPRSKKVYCRSVWKLKGESASVHRAQHRFPFIPSPSDSDTPPSLRLYKYMYLTKGA